MKSLSEIVSKRVSLSIKRIIFITLFITLISMWVVITNSAISNVKENGELYSVEVDDFISNKISLLEVASNTISSGVIDSSNFGTYVDSLKNMFNDVSAVYISLPEHGVVYKDGINTYMSGGWLPPDDFLVSQRDWYKNAVNSSDIYISEPYVDEQSGDICVTLSHSIKTSNGNGVIGLDMYLSDLTNFTSSISTNSNSIIVVSKDGTIITHPLEEFTLTSINDTRYKKYDTANNVKFLLDYAGGIKLGVAVNLDVTGWTLIYTSSVLGILIFISVLIIFLLVIAFVSERFAITRLLNSLNPMFKPLESVTANIHNITDGKLDYKFEEDSQSTDVHNVTISLNTAIDGLKSYIDEINRVVNAISDKNIDIDINSNFPGDYSSIKDALLSVVSDLNKSFVEIKSQSDLVLEYSTSLSSTSELVAESATTQSVAVSSANKEIDNLSGTMNDIVNLTESVKDKNHETNERLTIGGTEMNDLVKAIDDIIDCFDDINKFVSEINAIASQTNLLSLNASIEAARAGDAGRGFAVVASEIQSLSTNAGSASKNINQIIEKSRIAVDNGKRLVEKTQKTIDLGIQYSVENTEIVDSIVKEVSIQRDSLEEIVSSFKDISSMIESNAASAQENSALAIQLGECAKSLSGTVNSYKLRR